MAGKKKGPDHNLLATNHKALRDYEILESLEAGIVLAGTEIKSVRNHQASLDESFGRIEGGEVILYNMHISPYEQGGRFNVEPARPRKLLLHRRQIERLNGLLSRKGLALVPLRLYLVRGMAKVELAVGKGKKLYEKRDVIRKRDTDRELRRILRRTNT